MTTKIKGEEKLAESPKKKEDKFDPSQYSCEILLEKTTPEKANDKKYGSNYYSYYYEI